MRVTMMLLSAMLLSSHAWAQSNSSSASADVGRCIADARWSNTNASLTYSKQTQIPVSVSLLTHVSKGKSCTNAEIRVTVTYLTEAQEFICSGTIPQAMTATLEAQTFNLEIRPFTQNDFLRWINQPGNRGMQQGKRLPCTSPDGTAEIGDINRIRASWIHLAVAVMPDGGGLAVLEALVHVNP